MILPRIQVPTLPAPFNPYALPGLAAAYDASDLNSITHDSANRVSQWSDKSGNGRHLVQATGSAQPLLLPWSGANYGYLPGVLGNNFSTTSPTLADIHVEWFGSMDSWAPADYMCLVSEGDSFVFNFYVEPTGKLRLEWANSVGTVVFRSSTIATGFSAATIHGVKATLKADNGSGANDVKFYTSSDGVNWIQLGTTVSTAGTSSVHAAGGLFRVGVADGGGAYAVAGKCFSASVRAVIDGPILRQFDASQAAHNATSWASSTGETWTVNQSGAKPAQIVGRTSVLFDGSAYYLKTAAFTLNQPTTIIIVGKQIAWTANHYICDGNAADSMVLYQSTSTPNTQQYAGANGATATAWTLGINAVLSSVFNGAASLMRVNRLSSTTGNPSTNNAGGFTLAVHGDASGNFTNIQVSRIFIFSAALDAATLDKIAVWCGQRELINV